MLAYKKAENSAELLKNMPVLLNKTNKIMNAECQDKLLTEKIQKIQLIGKMISDRGHQ